MANLEARCSATAGCSKVYVKAHVTTLACIAHATAGDCWVHPPGNVCTTIAYSAHALQGTKCQNPWVTRQEDLKTQIIASKDDGACPEGAADEKVDILEGAANKGGIVSEEAAKQDVDM